MTSQIPDPNEQSQPGAAGTGDPTVPGQPEAPQAPSTPEAPQQPGYQAPPAGEQPQYAAPQQPYQQQYEQPQYAQQGQYIPPAGAAQGEEGNLQLNYWLSVFFMFIPALIFYFTEKGRSQKLDLFNRENLNFSLVRTGVWLITVIFTSVPIIGWLIWVVGLLAQLVLFVFHIMAAAKAKENFDAGQNPGFVFNVPLIK